jgi:hypothetical protein
MKENLFDLSRCNSYRSTQEPDDDHRWSKHVVRQQTNTYKTVEIGMCKKLLSQVFFENLQVKRHFHTYRRLYIAFIDQFLTDSQVPQNLCCSLNSQLR